jgi:hypothetical protein
VLGFHVFANTDRQPNEMGRQIQRIARGPNLDAQLGWLEGYHDGTEQWKAMLVERSVKNDSVLRYDGRLLVFHIYVNTDQDPHHIHKAILRIARGPRLDICVAWTELHEGEPARELWATLQKVNTKVQADPNAKPFDMGPL